MLNFFTQLPVAVQAAGLLVLSNCFMTFAWYGHLKYLSGSAWYVAAVVSWSIALFEYLLQVFGAFFGAAQDHAGGDHAHGLYPLCAFRDEGAFPDGLRLGGALHGGGGLFHLPVGLSAWAAGSVLTAGISLQALY